jgi:hypothetical protein
MITTEEKRAKRAEAAKRRDNLRKELPSARLSVGQGNPKILIEFDAGIEDLRVSYKFNDNKWESLFIYIDDDIYLFAKFCDACIARLNRVLEEVNVKVDNINATKAKIVKAQVTEP